MSFRDHQELPIERAKELLESAVQDLSGKMAQEILARPDFISGPPDPHAFSGIYDYYSSRYLEPLRTIEHMIMFVRQEIQRRRGKRSIFSMLGNKRWKTKTVQGADLAELSRQVNTVLECLPDKSEVAKIRVEREMVDDAESEFVWSALVIFKYPEEKKESA